MPCKIKIPLTGLFKAFNNKILQVFHHVSQQIKGTCSACFLW